MNKIDSFSIKEDELEISAIRAQGAGGQNVNKVSSAIHLRYDIRTSSLTDDQKQRLLTWQDQRITNEGVIVIKAQSFRTQEKNLQDAKNRLQQLLSEALKPVKARKKTRPSLSSKRKRMDKKTQHGKKKALRGRNLSFD